MWWGNGAEGDLGPASGCRLGSLGVEPKVVRARNARVGSLCPPWGQWGDREDTSCHHPPDGGTEEQSFTAAAYHWWVSPPWALGETEPVWSDRDPGAGLRRRRWAWSEPGHVGCASWAVSSLKLGMTTSACGLRAPAHTGCSGC